MSDVNPTVLVTGFPGAGKTNDHKIELNRGSIFCACIRTDFTAELKRLATDVKPDLLLIEATGIARVDDLYAMMSQDGLDRLLRARGVSVFTFITSDDLAESLSPRVRDCRIES